MELGKEHRKDTRFREAYTFSFECTVVPVRYPSGNGQQANRNTGVGVGERCGSDSHRLMAASHETRGECLVRRKVRPTEIQEH